MSTYVPLLICRVDDRLLVHSRSLDLRGRVQLRSLFRIRSRILPGGSGSVSIRLFHRGTMATALRLPICNVAVTPLSVRGRRTFSRLLARNRQGHAAIFASPGTSGLRFSLRVSAFDLLRHGSVDSLVVVI